MIAIPAAVDVAALKDTTLLNMGMPPPSLEPAFAALDSGVQEVIVKALREYGDCEEEKLAWAVPESPFGPAVEKSLSGPLRAVQRGRARIWLDDPPLESFSLLLPLSDNWAELVEEEERKAIAEIVGREYRVPASRRLPRASKLAVPTPPTHPPTQRNDGRPAPTAVWTEAKPPRQAGGASGSQRTQRPRKGRYLLESEEDESEYSDDG